MIFSGQSRKKIDIFTTLSFSVYGELDAAVSPFSESFHARSKSKLPCQCPSANVWLRLILILTTSRGCIFDVCLFSVIRNWVPRVC